MINRLWILLCLLQTHYAATAQDTSVIADARLVSSYVNEVISKADGLSKKLDNYTAKALTKLQKHEAGIKRKLAKTDSLKAVAVFSDAEQQYKQLEQRLQNTTVIRQYIPSLDTITSSLKFLQQKPTTGFNYKGHREHQRIA